MLDPAKEPDRRGAVFGFDLLGMRDDDRPDAPQLGDLIGVVADAEIVIHARLADGRHARSGVTEGSLAVQTVHLTDLAFTDFSEQSAQCDVARHTLGEERQPLPAEIGVDTCLRGDGPAGRDPRHQAADVGPRRSDGETERARLAVAR